MNHDEFIRQCEFDTHTYEARLALNTFRLLHVRLLAFLAVCSLSGCALAPDSARVEAQHTSHLSQHEPFTAHTHSAGYNLVGLTAVWRLPAHFQAELSEGYNLQKERDDYCGALRGGHEVFTARVSYTFWEK